MKNLILTILATALLSGCASTKYHHITVKDPESSYSVVIERKGFLAQQPELLLEQQKEYFMSALDTESRAMNVIIEEVAPFDNLELLWEAKLLATYSTLFLYEIPQKRDSRLLAESRNLNILKAAKSAFERVGGRRHSDAYHVQTLIDKRLCGKSIAEFEKSITSMRSIEGRRKIIRGGR